MEREEMDGLCDETVYMQPLFGSTSNNIYKMNDNSVICVSTRKRDTVKVDHDTNPKLFIDNIWPGSFVLADYLQNNQNLCVARLVIELGAGTALPGLVASKLGASNIVITDYPDESVMDNLMWLVDSNNATNTKVMPHQWGGETDSLLEANNGDKYDLILIAEPLWKDTYCQHDNLLQSVNALLSPTGTALVAFAHRPTAEHRPSDDLAFFKAAQDRYGLRSLRVLASSRYRDAQEEDEDFIEVMLYALSRHQGAQTDSREAPTAHNS